MNKKMIPYTLLTTRTISFIPIILSTYDYIDLSMLKQILLSGTIITSDIFDGIISRKISESEREKILFRMLDVAVDKSGIILCLFGLLKSKKISPSLFATILAYNGILLSAGVINYNKSKNKKEKDIQAITSSRLYTLLTGVSILLHNNHKINANYEKIITSTMAILGINTLYNQYVDKNANDNNIVLKRTKV